VGKAGYCWGLISFKRREGKQRGEEECRQGSFSFKTFIPFHRIQPVAFIRLHVQFRELSHYRFSFKTVPISSVQKLNCAVQFLNCIPLNSVQKLNCSLSVQFSSETEVTVSHNYTLKYIFNTHRNTQWNTLLKYILKYNYKY